MYTFEYDYIMSEVSSDDEFSILSIIKGEPESSGTTSRKERAVRRPKQTHGLIEDDFKVQIPSIFLTDGKKNAQIARRNDVIIEEINKEHEDSKKHSEELQIKRDQLLMQLSCDKRLSIVDNRDLQLINTILNEAQVKGEWAISRHFYFFFDPILLEYDDDPLDDYKYDDNDSGEIIERIVLQTTDVRRLKRIFENTQKLEEDISMSRERLTSYLEKLGANMSLLTENMPLNFSITYENKFIKLQILRLAIILKLILNSSNDLDFILRIFFFTLLDSNLQKDGYDEVVLFSSVIFEKLIVRKINWEDDPELYILTVKLHEALQQSFECSPNLSSELRLKLKYEVIFNVLKIIDDSCSSIVLLKVVKGLLIMSIGDSRSLLNESISTSWLTLENVDSLCKMIRSTLFKSDSLPKDMPSKVYESFFKIQILELLMKRSFRVYFSNDADVETMKKSNYNDLSKKIASLSKLLSDVYSQIGAIEYCEFSEFPKTFKEFLLSHATACFGVLNSLCERLQRDLKLCMIELTISDVQV